MSTKENNDFHSGRNAQVDALRDRIAIIDEKVLESKAALHAWADSENATLDKIEESLRNQDEAIDVKEREECESPVLSNSHFKEIDDLLARADELLLDAKRSEHQG